MKLSPVPPGMGGYEAGLRRHRKGYQKNLRKVKVVPLVAGEELCDDSHIPAWCSRSAVVRVSVASPKRPPRRGTKLKSIRWVTEEETVCADHFPPEVASLFRALCFVFTGRVEIE